MRIEDMELIGMALLKYGYIEVLRLTIRNGLCVGLPTVKNAMDFIDRIQWEMIDGKIRRKEMTR